MAIVFTSAISVPNIPRAVLVAVQFFDNSAMLDWEVRNNVSGRAKALKQWIRNTADGRCDVLKQNQTPVTFDDDVIVDKSSLSISDAATQVEAAYTGANKAARLRAVEQKCLDLAVVTIAGNVQ